MKKVVLTVIVSLAAVLALPLAASADTLGVSGNVTHNGSDVSGANVSVTCTPAHGAASTGSGTTQSNGDYFVGISPSACGVGDTVVVKVTDGSLNGQNTGTFGPSGLSGLDIALVNVSVSLPEMGAVTGAIAAIAAGGAFLVIRRRNFAKG